MRLIDADGLRRSMNYIIEKNQNSVKVDHGYWIRFKSVLQCIDSAPTLGVLDLVDVVRCRNCKHWIESSYPRGTCTRMKTGTSIHYYCASGERKDEL